MGQVLIEIPQNVKRTFRVKSSEYSEQLLKELEENSDTAITPAIVPPRRNSLKKDSEAVLGIWADREETADENARRVRGKNRKKLETIELNLPDLDDVDASEAVGIWADREESGEEIARKIREANRRVT